MSVEEPVTYYEIVGVRQAAFRIQEDNVPFVFAHRPVVALDDINGVRVPIQCIDLAKRVPRGGRGGEPCASISGFSSPHDMN
ncbi:hypothetical protein KBJ94_29245 [Pseudomonas sp. ITA]|uniref:hypothetical protein n=1 Tax=Pseudomonas sp. ITA TaxID=2825841 RepID=UPI002498845C|nr:hypothetical protein [Pseudomonas sp. ITA]MDI2146136.1 hypothetical protein [Pseudomonas sp. ITA]